MSRADRRRWKSARTLADLGELVALWLSREAQSLPGYQPRYGPDEETTPLIGVLAACNRAGYVTKPVVTRPTPPPPGPAPTVLCRECGCTAIDWQVCNDGCSGVLDQADGRCRACIDPSVIIDWSKEPEEKECALCGAPFFHAGSYCSLGCEAADGYSDEDTNEDEQPSSAPARPCGSASDDPWATSPF